MSRRTLGSVHTPDVGHHRWVPVTRLPLPAGGYGRFSRPARLFLFEMRWRKPPPRPLLRITAWTLSLCLHVVALVTMSLMHPPPYAPSAAAGEKDVIKVRFIQAPKKPPPPPPLKLPVRRAAKRHVATAPRSGQATLPDMTVVAPRHHAAKSKTAKPAAKPAPRSKTRVAKAPTPAMHAVSPEPVPQTPPPPRVALQVTPLSLPEPKVSSDVASRVSSPSSRDHPVSVSPLQVTNEISSAGVQAPPDQRPQASLQGVTRVDMTPSPDAAPAPAIQPQASRPAIAAPTVQPRSEQAPAVHVAPIANAAVASVAAPSIHLPHMSAQVGAPSLPQAQPGALALPTAPQPVPIQPVPRAAIPVASVPAPASTSWVKSSAADQFATRKAPAGKGVRLYGKHGALALSGSGSGKKGTPDYIQHEPQGNSDVMQRNTSSIHYQSTRFNKYWTPLGETALQTAFRHLVEEFTYTKTIHVARGARIKCAISPLMLMSFFSCGSGNPPSPPPPTDGDRRLDMAPARPLVQGLGPKPASSSPSPPLPTRDTTSCDTAKVAGSPPPPGCPLTNQQRKKSDQW